jgi:hypothetical protein
MKRRAKANEESNKKRSIEKKSLQAFVEILTKSEASRELIEKS